MDRIVERLPSPGGFALWLYALVFFVLPAFLAYKGFVYVLGTLIFAIGLYPNVQELVNGRPVKFALNWRGQRRVWEPHFSLPSEKFAVKLVSIGLVLFTMFIVPFLLFIMQKQAITLYDQVDSQLPAILLGLDNMIEWGHRQFPDLVPAVDVEEGGGWKGLTHTLKELGGDKVEIDGVLKPLLAGIVAVVGELLADWVKLVISAIIIGTVLSNWKKEVAAHRAIISNGIKDERLRANVLRFGEHFQTGVSLFMIGFIEVAATLSVFYLIALTVLPLGIGFGAILFMSVVLGIITAVPKIGGILGMIAGALLVLTNLEPGLGWFGWQVVSFGLFFDIVIRLAAVLAIAKLAGVLEAYSYTPEIIGQRLNMTKIQIIATVLTWAVGAGFFGMIWGVLLALMFQAAVRLAEERKGEEIVPAEVPDEPAPAGG